MVSIDFDFASAASLKEIADNFVAFFNGCDVPVKTGVFAPQDSCPLLIVVPDRDANVQKMQGALDKVQQSYALQAQKGDENAARHQFLLSAIQVNQEELDNLPCGMIVKASPFVHELAESLRGFSTLEAA